MDQPATFDRKRRPTSATWKLSRNRPLSDTIREATEKTIEVYGEALRKLAKY